MRVRVSNWWPLQVKTGTYHYKITGLKAAPFGDMAEGLPECEGATVYELENAIVAACKEASGFPEFNWVNSVVTPKVSLFTACIGTHKQRDIHRWIDWLLTCSCILFLCKG